MPAHIIQFSICDMDIGLKIWTPGKNEDESEEVPSWVLKELLQNIH